MDEQKISRAARAAAARKSRPENESLVYGKNPVTELLKSGSGVDTVLIAEGMAPAVAAYYTAHGQGGRGHGQAGASQQAAPDDRHREPPGRGRLCQRDRICDRGGPAERLPESQGRAAFPGAE